MLTLAEIVITYWESITVPLLRHLIFYFGTAEVYEGAKVDKGDLFYFSGQSRQAEVDILLLRLVYFGAPRKFLKFSFSLFHPLRLD